MIFDPGDPGVGGVLDAEICVIGSGPAGISIALQFIDSDHDVLVLEAGPQRIRNESKAAFDGEVIGHRHHDPKAYRSRVFGGTSVIWGGRCLPFKPIDFSSRPWVDAPGWPIEFADVAKYYLKALELCHAGRDLFSAKELFPEEAEMVAGFEDGDLVTTGIERWSLPTDFAKEYASAFQGSRNVKVLMNAECLRLRSSASGSSIEAAEVALPDRTVSIRAKLFIVAAGGLETPRLLLLSEADGHRPGLDPSLPIGRYYMGHITGIVASLDLYSREQVIRKNYRRDGDVYVRNRLALSEEVQVQNGLLNFGALFHHPLIYDPSHGNPVLSSMFVAKGIRAIGQRIPPAIIGLAPGERVSARDWARHLANIVLRFPQLAAFLPSFVAQRWMRRRRIPSVVLSGQGSSIPIFFHSEQSPNPESRIRLSDSERDAHGRPRIAVDLRLRSTDIDSVVRAHDVLDRAFRDQGVGAIRWYERDRPGAVLRGYTAGDGHFIGTARMGEDPKTSVVDRNCRVHGTDNLYVASSATFSTSGEANCTLSVIALALRLADHLRDSVLGH